MFGASPHEDDLRGYWKRYYCTSQTRLSHARPCVDHYFSMFLSVPNHFGNILLAFSVNSQTAVTPLSTSVA